MPAFRGNFWQIGFGHQTAEGTLTNPTQMFRWLQGAAVMPDMKVTDEYEGDGGIDPGFLNKDSSLWKGKFSFYPRSTEIGQILSFVMGGTASETVISAMTGATITASGTGGTIPAGTYAASIAFLYGQVEGPAMAKTSGIVVTSGQTIGAASIPADANATKVRLYLSVAGSTNLTQYVDFPYTSGVTTSVSYTGTPAATTFGASLINVGATTGKVHFFKPQTTLDFWTCEFGQTITGPGAPTNQIRNQIADCLATSFSLEGDAGKPIKASVEFVGKYSQVVAALQSAVFDTASTPLIMANSVFVKDGTAVTLVGKFKFDWKLTVDQSLIFTHIYPDAFVLERRKASVDYELLFTDASIYYQMLSGGAVTTPVAGTVYDTPVLPTGSIDLRFLPGGNDTSQELGITIPNLTYVMKDVAPNGDGKPFMVPVSGTTTRPASGANLLTAQVRNAQVSAY